MWTEIRKHIIAYSVLTLGMIAFAVVYPSVWPDKTAERVLIGVLALAYFVWGILTHVKSKRLTRFVVQEYAAIALLGGTMLLLLTF